MHFLSIIALLPLAMTMVAGAAVSRGAEASSFNAELWNGTEVKTVTVHPREQHASLGRRDTLNCKGSSRCSKGLSSECLAAYNMIQAGNTYIGGNAGSSGVCSGSCGVFLQGTNGQSSGSCSYAGSVLQTSYNDIRNDGCVACGSEIFDNGCEVTINYVTSC